MKTAHLVLGTVAVTALCLLLTVFLTKGNDHVSSSSYRNEEASHLQSRQIAQSYDNGADCKTLNDPLARTKIPSRKEIATTAKTFTQTLNLGVKPEGIGPGDGGILLALLNLTGCEFVVESGVHLGSSTKMFADHFRGEMVISVDSNAQKLFASTIQEFHSYPNVLFKIGDGLEVLPRIIRSLRGTFGVFLDGPKCISALPLVRNAIAQGAKFVAVHDACGCLRANAANREKLGATFFLNLGRDPSMKRLLEPDSYVDDCFANPGVREKSITGGGGLGVWVPGLE